MSDLILPTAPHSDNTHSDSSRLVSYKLMYYLSEWPHWLTIPAQPHSSLNTCTDIVSISPADCPVYDKDWSDWKWPACLLHWLWCSISIVLHYPTPYIPISIPSLSQSNSFVNPDIPISTSQVPTPPPPCSAYCRARSKSSPTPTSSSPNQISVSSPPLKKTFISQASQQTQFQKLLRTSKTI